MSLIDLETEVRKALHGDLMASGKDLYKYIAGTIYGIPEGEVSDAQRTEVKQACYAVLYGREAVHVDTKR